MSNKYFLIGLGIVVLSLGVLGLTTGSSNQTAVVGAILAVPALTAAQPMAVNAGEVISLGGVGFGAGEPYNVSFVGVAAGVIRTVPVTGASTVELKVAVPADLTLGIYKVSVAKGTGSEWSNSVNLVVVPKLESVSPSSGVAGDKVVLSWKNLPGGDTAVVVFENPVNQTELSATAKTQAPNKLVVTVPSTKTAAGVAAFIKVGKKGVDGWSNKVPFFISK